MTMLRKVCRSGVALALSIIAAAAHAGLVNDVPSCYAAYKLGGTPQQEDRELYVLIDQTVLLDPNLQQSVLDNLSRMVQPGVKFTVAEFSAFSQSRYLKVLHTGYVERPLPEDAYGNVPITKAPQIRSCFDKQLGFSRKMATDAAHDAMSGATSTLNDSEIMGALGQVGQALRDGPAKTKVLFLVTDGLENSRTTSFYARNAVRDVTPSVELGKARAAGMLADLGGAHVYVLGGGTMLAPATGTQAQRDGYRDAKTMHDLRDFWGEYLGASHAQLVEFGAPSLVTPLSY